MNKNVQMKSIFFHRWQFIIDDESHISHRV